MTLVAVCTGWSRSARVRLLLAQESAMSYGQDYPLEYGYSAESMAAERASFIRRTYAHVAGAIVAFTAIEALLLTFLSQPTKINIVRTMFTGSWLLVLLAFMAVGLVARYCDRNPASVSSPDLGLSP